MTLDARRAAPSQSRFAPARRRAGKAVGAISGQLSQALGSFVLQALAARELGAAGLGLFALMYGSVVLGTAVSSGLIGDSLTVLDRGDRRTRAALQNWCLIVSTGAGIMAATIGYATGALTVAVALLFGALTTIFIIEDALRRSLMAVLRFWRLPVVDFASLAVSLIYLAGCSAGGLRPTIGQFLAALMVGQAVAALVAIPLLPRHERPIVAARSNQMRPVFTFGIWRAAQQSVRPGLLTAARLIVTVIAGVAAYGQLEAARVYMAPALLIVAGMGSMLLPLWVKNRADGLAALLRRADRMAMGLFGLTLVLGAMGTLALPYLGGLLTDGKYRIASAAVFGWAFYAASTAAVTPFGTLAALQGKQGRLLILRLLEPFLAIITLLLFLLAFRFTPTFAPYALSVGAVISSVVIRYVILVPLARSTNLRPGPRHRRVDGNAVPIQVLFPQPVTSPHRSPRRALM